VPRTIMNIDFDDEIQIREQPCTVEDISEMLRKCKDMGVDTIVWRCTTLGRADYRSNVMTRADAPYDRTDAEAEFGSCRWLKGDAEMIEDYVRRRTGYHEKSRRILTDYDPPAVARELTASFGMELYLWLDIFDEYFPGLGSRFLREHPECQWISRDGERHFRGLRCYGFPEAVENQLEVVRELTAYEPDGLYLSTSCHSRHCNREGEWNGYGFEKPVVDRYRQRHGTGIREADFDTKAWHRVKGEFVTELCSRIKDILRPLGQKLMLPAPIGDHKVWDWPLFSGQPIAQYHVDWRAHVDQGIADSLILGEYQPVWREIPPGHWRRLAEEMGITDLRLMMLETQAAETCRAYAAGRCELYYWTGWMRTRKNIERVLGCIDRAMSTQPMNGVVLHELMSFERADFFPRLGA